MCFPHDNYGFLNPLGLLYLELRVLSYSISILLSLPIFFIVSHLLFIVSTFQGYGLSSSLDYYPYLS